MDKILLEVEIEDSSVTSAVTEIIKAKDAIVQLQQAQKDLAAQGQTNSAQFIKNNEDIKTLNKTISDNSKTIQANNQLQKAAADSIDGLRAANTLLLKEKNSLSTTDEASKKRIAEINALYDKNTETINDNSSATEKQKMNIGNYGSALDKIIPGLGGVTQGIESSTKAAWTFVANPIGAVIGALGLAVGALTAYFKGSEEGQDRLAKITAVLSVGLNKMQVIIEGIGEELFNLSNGEQTALDKMGIFGETIKISLIPLQLLITGLQKAADLFTLVFPEASKAISDTIKGVIKEGQEIADLEDSIEAREREMIVNRAETNKKVAELREKALSEEGNQRRATIQEAINLEKSLSDNEVIEAKRRLELIDLQNKSTGKLTEEQKTKRSEALADIINKQAQSYEATLRFQKEIERLNDQDVAANQKALDDKKKSEEDYFKDLQILNKNAQDLESQKLKAKQDNDAQIEADAQELQNYFNEITQQKIDNDVKEMQSNDKKNKKISEDDKKQAQIDYLLNQQKLSNASTVLNQIKGLLDQHSLEYKALAEAQNGIDTFRAATAALAPPPIGAGPLFGPILAATTVALGLANAIKIASYEDGGVIPISGKSHTAGGEDVAIGGQRVANVQGGEHLVVLKRGAYDIFNQLSRANELAGGVAFSRDSSPRRYLADGGFVARTASVSVPSMDQLAQQFTNSISGLKIYTRTTELQKVQDNVAQVKVLSELR